MNIRCLLGLTHLVLISAPVLIPGSSFSQYDNHPELTEKYRHYRQRLLSEFMLCTGTGPGCSLPASIRNTRDENYRGNETIQWGDGTIDLAVYISVLATEYRLLTDENKNTAPVLTELYYALEAFNRLDYYGDTCFNRPPALNGFFIRSDAGAGLIDDEIKMQETLKRLNVSGREVNRIRSEFLNFSEGDLKRFAVSKDQIFLLLMGMRLITQFIPEEIQSPAGPFRDGELSFSKEAKNITLRLIDWIHPPGKSNFFTRWKICTPEGKKVKAGSNAWTYAPLLIEIKNKITGKNSQIKNGFSWTLAKGIREFTWLAYKPVFVFNRSESFKTLLLETLAGRRKNKAGQFYRRSHTFPPYNWHLIPLLYGCLYHSWPENVDLNFYLTLLNSAPEEGPYHFPETGFGDKSWSSTSLIIHPARTSNAEVHFPGRYNGLDFMLLYNLFLMAEKNQPFRH